MGIPVEDPRGRHESELHVGGAHSGDREFTRHPTTPARHAADIRVYAGGPPVRRYVRDPAEDTRMRGAHRRRCAIELQHGAGFDPVEIVAAPAIEITSRGHGASMFHAGGDTHVFVGTQRDLRFTETRAAKLGCGVGAPAIRVARRAYRTGMPGPGGDLHEPRSRLAFSTGHIDAARHRGRGTIGIRIVRCATVPELTAHVVTPTPYRSCSIDGAGVPESGVELDVATRSSRRTDDFSGRLAARQRRELKGGDNGQVSAVTRAICWCPLAPQQ